MQKIIIGTRSSVHLTAGSNSGSFLSAQLSGRKSLRDLVMNVTDQTNKLYHLWLKPCSRVTLAGVYKKQPKSLFKTIFHKLLKRTSMFAPRHRFKFSGKLYLLDATSRLLTSACLYFHAADAAFASFEFIVE